MDAAEIAKRIDALEAGLAAKASRIADLEARVSLLEAENARLRKAMPNGQAMDHTGKRGPTFSRLEEDFGGNKQKPVDIAGGQMVNDVTEASDSEKEGMTVNVTSGKSVEEGVLPVRTHWECAEPVAIGESRSEDEIEDLGGCSGRESRDHGRSIHCDDNVGLEDDDVLIVPRGRKLIAARMITSDRGSEDEIDHAAGGGECDHENILCDDNVDLEDDDVSIIPHGRKRIAARMITSDSEDEDMNVKDDKVQEELGATPGRKRSLRGLNDSVSDNEDDAENVYAVNLKHVSCVAETGTENKEDDEDNRIPIREVVQNMSGKRGSRDDGGSGEMNGCFDNVGLEEEDDNVGLEEEDDDVSIIPRGRKRIAAQMITNYRGTEDEIDHSAGGGGSDHGNIHCDGNVDLEDDDVSIIPRGRKRIAARMITSDSEDEDMNVKDGKVQEELGATPGRKRSLLGLDDSVSDNEDDAENVRAVNLKHVSCVAETGTENKEDDEDDMIPIREVVQIMRGKRGSRDDGESGEINGCSTFTTSPSAQLVKTKAKRARVARCGLDFVEPREYMESEDDSEEAGSMDEFIDDEDCSENSSEVSAEPEESDSEVNYKDVMACIGRRRNANTKDWQYEAEMLSAFAGQPELCLRAVCALYRKQTEDEQSEKASMVHNGQGFNQLDAVRGSLVAEFLLDGDAFGPPKKTVHDLEKYDPDALEFCKKIAARYSKQLFAIYQNKEDPYFP